ncbi:MAG: MSMEG_6728 family protein [Candidatus Hodarchaeota archaeon]
MQTFLPYPDFTKSAQCLDYRRLGKQRVECKQILRALTNDTGWSNHPAVRMWMGYEQALCAYMQECIIEWVRRGYQNNLQVETSKQFKLPGWFGYKKFHSSHRSNLLRKDPNYYGKFGWVELPNLPYWWPIK